MKKKTSSSSFFLSALVVAVIALGILFLGTPCIFRALPRAALAEAISNTKQVKLALDSFAMDNDGLYPCAETAPHYDLPADSSTNALFRQLFASENTKSERIFWVKGAAICSEKAPDDVSTIRGVFYPAETLQPGDCGLAYVQHQTNLDNPSRPLLFDSPPTASGLEFDRDLWEGKVVVLRIDSSAKPMRLNGENRLLDADGKELLTTASDVWKGKLGRPDITRIEIAYPLKQ